MNVTELALLIGVAVVAILLFRLRPDAPPPPRTIPQPPRPVSSPASPGTGFRFVVEDVFSISGRGTVLTGQVQSGVVKIGDPVVLRRADGRSSAHTVIGVEMFRKVMDQAQTGDNVGLLIRGLKKDDVARGDVLEQG